MKGIDATVLTLLLNERSDAPPNPHTGRPVERVTERVNFLVATLQKEKQKIIIPTPVLAEVLVQSGPEGLRYVEVLQKASVFELKDFDKLAAIELALMTKTALNDPVRKKKGASPSEPWQKIKIDRQIVAICKVAGVSTLYVSDRSLSNFAREVGMTVIGVHELPLPPEDPQLSLHDLLEEASSDQDAPEAPQLTDDDHGDL